MQCTLPSLRMGQHPTLMSCQAQNARPVHHMTRRVSCRSNAAANSNTEIVASLSQDVKTTWDECTGLLVELGLEPEAADTAIIKAFGWGGQQYWRQEKVQEVPSAAQVLGVLQVLEEFSIVSTEDKATIIGKFPELLGLPLDLIRSNFEKLQKQYFLKGPSLVAAVKRKPRVLGSIVDCQGSCEGFCTRCFVQF